MLSGCWLFYLFMGPGVKRPEGTIKHLQHSEEITVRVLSCYRKRNKRVQNRNKSPSHSVTVCWQEADVRDDLLETKENKKCRQSAKKNRLFHPTAEKPESQRVKGQTWCSWTRRKSLDLHSDGEKNKTKICIYSGKKKFLGISRQTAPAWRPVSPFWRTGDLDGVELRKDHETQPLAHVGRSLCRKNTSRESESSCSSRVSNQTCCQETSPMKL